MQTFAVAVIGSYLLGSIPFAYLAGRIAGIDIRKCGSGNVGATNVIRTLGKSYGYPVFVADFLKGLGAVKLSMLIAPRLQPEWNSPEMFGIVAAIFSVLGHSFPVWLHFKGGKGVATSAGALFGLAPVAALIGAAVGFLWYNAFPAEVIMGDTGSMAFGGAIATFAIMTKTEVLLIFIGGIFVIEALSVMIQVFSFKYLGRRVFLMAPIHHHFEMKAWSETKIMVRFWIVAGILCSAGFALFYRYYFGQR